jgi:hypothetical protein
MAGRTRGLARSGLHRTADGRTRLGVLLVVLGVLSTGMITLSSSASAAVTSVRGSACSYYVNVGLFAGPQNLRGCGQPADAPAAAKGASVALQPNGSNSPQTATAPGAKAQYGPAVISGGLWPCEDVGTDPDGDGITGNCPASAPASGPQSASTQGTPASGTVTSSADIKLNPTPVPVKCFPGWGPNPPSTDGCVSYGGSGPYPVQADSLHVECTATESSVTGSTTLKNAQLATSTDIEGNPLDQQPVPDQPPVNYTRSGVITNVGDVFTVVYNQQIVNPDGSLTVNAVHMYLFGPTAVGEVIRGQATCGVTPTSVSSTDTVAPSCGIPVVAPVAPDNPTPKDPLTVLIGTFDAGGLQTVEVTQHTNATVDVGSSDPSSLGYLKFAPGQTNPLAITAVRDNATQGISFTFVATDKAGNKNTVAVTADGIDDPTVTCAEVGPDGSTTSSSSTTSTTGGTGTTVTTHGTGTTVTTSGTGTTVTTRNSATTTTVPGGVTASPSSVAPGGTVKVNSALWQASSEVTVILHSDPVTLATLTADATGLVDGNVTIPAATAVGAHTLELAGTGSTGSPKSVSTPLTVTAASSGGGTGGTSTGGDPVTVSQGALSRTGFNLQPFAYLASLSLVVGGLLIIAGRRRRAALTAETRR